MHPFSFIIPKPLSLDLYRAKQPGTSSMALGYSGREIILKVSWIGTNVFQGTYSVGPIIMEVEICLIILSCWQHWLGRPLLLCLSPILGACRLGCRKGFFRIQNGRRRNNWLLLKNQDFYLGFNSIIAKFRVCDSSNRAIISKCFQMMD